MATVKQLNMSADELIKIFTALQDEARTNVPLLDRNAIADLFVETIGFEAAGRILSKFDYKHQFELTMKCSKHVIERMKAAGGPHEGRKLLNISDTVDAGGKK